MKLAPFDWKPVQARLGARVDGDPGRETWGKLFALAAGRPVDATIERMAQAAARECRARGIDQTPNRVADFISNIAHETALFTRFEENLNYSAKRLAEIFPGRYASNPNAKAEDRQPNARALALHRRPEAIGNDTYGLRMGNLSTTADNDNNPDGWQYRGRGPGMLTGKGNYIDASAATGLDLVKFPDLASDPGVGVLIIAAYVERRKLNARSDAGDPTGYRIGINGGKIGLSEVLAIRAKLLKVLAA